MQFIDMHCDSLMMLFFKGRNNGLYEAPQVSVDFKRMKQGGQMAQFFAVCIPPDNAYELIGMKPIQAETYISELTKSLLDSVEKHRDIIAMAYNAEDIKKNWKQGRISAVLTMEDGRTVDGKLENLKRYYDMGFRALTLTWNYSNCFGEPNSKAPVVMKTGLTNFGKEAVAYMQELGMLVDVSHLSEGGFYDVYDVCKNKKPFVATHSNSRELSPHQRNLSDAQIRILGNVGGAAGINFGPEFLNENVECKNSTAKLIARHARHMADVGGVDCVSLGSDFDGIGGNLEINDCSQVYMLEEALKREDFTGCEIEKIFYGNVLRVMKEAVK